MGTTFIKSSSIIDKSFITNLQFATPLKNLEQEETQIHEIYSHSLEHYQVMLEKIRIKKAYDCPYIIKILDSHTLESQNLCSTVIKTYIVVEKPQKLADEIEERISLKMGFSESEIWTLVYSCVIGGSYFLRNNVSLSRLTTNKVYIDIKGNIKINDPQFSQSNYLSENIPQSEFIYSLYEIVQQLKDLKPIFFTAHLSNLLCNMRQRKFSLDDIKNYIDQNYLQSKKKVNRICIVSSKKKTTASRSKSKKIKVVSGRKNSTISDKYQNDNQTSAFTNYDSLVSYRFSNSNKENKSDNETKERIKNNLELLAFKDPLRGIQLSNNNNLEIQPHMFPKKALFGQRKKIQEKRKEPLSNQYLESLQFNHTDSKKQCLTKSRHSILIDTDNSLEGSQLMNIISYQVDQQTSVRQVCQEQSEYILSLLNKCKCSASSSLN